MHPPVVPRRLMLQIICDALAGLHYAHELQDCGGNSLDIVHCDVSPDNVFVTHDEHVKVVDFGIARAAGVDDSGSFRGRLAYAAPEQISGGPADRRADIFAMGVILWEFLAQRRFAPRDLPDYEVVSRRLTGAEPRISSFVPRVPVQLARTFG